MPFIHFLLVYDHGLGRLVQARPYDDPVEAGEAYAAMEREHRDELNIEIVLVGSDSLDTIRQTHGNYFDGDSDAELLLRSAAVH